MKNNYKEFIEKITPDDALVNKTAALMRSSIKPKSRDTRKYIKLVPAVLAAAAAVSVLSVNYFKIPFRPDKYSDADNSFLYGAGNGPRVPSSDSGADIHSPYNPETDNNPEQTENSEQSENAERDKALFSDDSDNVSPALIESLTLDEVYSVSKSGNFVARSILPGYKFECAGLSRENKKESLSVTFTNGFDYIEIFVSQLEEQDKSRVVDINDVDLYDISRYSVPLADSVPAELYETVHYPIFKWDEINDDTVALRTLTVSEAGQGQKQSVSFSILCDGFVVRYNLRGSNLTGILDMVKSSDFYKNSMAGADAPDRGGDI